MDPVRRNISTRTSNAINKGPSILIKNKAKSTANILEHARPILGEIHNVNKNNEANKNPSKGVHKLNIARKINLFPHVKPKVDTNLHTKGNKAVIRSVKSTADVGACNKIAQKQVIQTFNKPELVNVSKLSTHLSKSCSDINENVTLTAEMIKELEKIEYADRFNEYMLVEYKKEIYEYLLTLEEINSVSEKFLKDTAVNEKMRSILVNWIIDVEARFNLSTDTLHLTISVLDRYLQKSKSIPKSKLQLVGIGAMMIASKYEEIYSPDVNDFLYMCKDAYTKKEVFDMEYTMLRALNFSLNIPLPIQFLRRFSRVTHADQDHYVMAKFFTELLLSDYSTCYYRPSAIAVAALCLTFTIFNKENIMPSKVWNPTMEYFSSHKFSDIDVIIKKLAKIVQSSIIKNQLPNKYSENSKLASRITKNPVLRSFILWRLAAKNS